MYLAVFSGFLGCFTCFCLLVCSDRQSRMNILVPTYLLSSASVSVEEIPKRDSLVEKPRVFRFRPMLPACET